MKDPIRRLPDAELEVMQAIWACKAPVARADIEKHLFQTHPMALTTLLTLLTRLSEKGFLSIEKVGRRSLYTPLFLRMTTLQPRAKPSSRNSVDAVFPPSPQLCVTAA